MLYFFTSIVGPSNGWSLCVEPSGETTVSSSISLLPGLPTLNCGRLKPLTSVLADHELKSFAIVQLLNSAALEQLLEYIVLGKLFPGSKIAMFVTMTFASIPEPLTSLTSIGIDKLGLDAADRKLLSTIVDSYQGGPVGLEALAATLNEEADTIADTLEPYLLKAGLLRRTSRGREATKSAYEHLELQSALKQKELF